MSEILTFCICLGCESSYQKPYHVCSGECRKDKHVDVCATCNFDMVQSFESSLAAPPSKQITKTAQAHQKVRSEGEAAI